MFTISAFADEISPDPQVQIDILQSCGVRHIELRSILGTNVLALSDLQVREFKALLDRHGFKISAIGSPLGKIRIDEPFAPHLDKLRRALDLCKVFGTPNVRIFSYYPPPNQEWDDCGDYRREVLDRIVYDPANYVFCGYDPWDGWQRTRQWTRHFHIKDWKKGEEHGSLPGEGQGQLARVMKDAVGMGYDGFATMEPHLLGGGPTGGQTGPALFPKAVAAFKRILDTAGAAYQ
jgi:sugar phosphate isomerase/epimerase